MKSEIESLPEDKFRSTVEGYLRYLHDQDERVRLVDQEELKSAIDKILKLINSTELKAQFEESHKLEEEIKKNLEAIGYGI